MEFLQSIFENARFPFISAFIPGLMTSVSPCPLATNITAIAFVSKEIENKRKVFLDRAGKEYYRHEGYFPFDKVIKILQQKGDQ